MEAIHMIHQLEIDLNNSIVIHNMYIVLYYIVSCEDIFYLNFYYNLWDATKLHI